MTVLDESSVDTEAERPNAWDTTSSTVKEFLETSNYAKTSILTVPAQNLVVDTTTGSLEVGGTDVSLWLDDSTINKVSKVLKVPGSYMNRCPEELRAHNLNYWLSRQEDKDLTLEFGSSSFEGRHQLVSMVPGSQTVLPMGRVIEAALSPFSETDQVSDFHLTDDQVTLSVITPTSEIEVPGLGTVRRPAKGDITQGGIKLRMFRQGTTKVILQPYLLRLICTNGMTAVDPASGRVAVSGESIDDIVDNISVSAAEMMGDIDRYLRQYARTAEIPVTGDRSQVILHLAQERGLSARLANEAVAEIGRYHDDITAYDVLNVFNELANHVSSIKVRNDLQDFAGHIAADPEYILDRCQSCTQLLH